MPELVPLAARPGSASASSSDDRRPPPGQLQRHRRADHAGADHRHLSVHRQRTRQRARRTGLTRPPLAGIGSRLAHRLRSSSHLSGAGDVESGGGVARWPTAERTDTAPATRNRQRRAAARGDGLQAGAVAGVERRSPTSRSRSRSSRSSPGLSPRSRSRGRTAARSRSRSAGRSLRLRAHGRLLDGRADLEVPDRGRPLLVGARPRRQGLELDDRLVQHRRPGRHRRLGRLRRRALPQRAARPLRRSTSSASTSATTTTSSARPGSCSR